MNNHFPNYTTALTRKKARLRLLMVVDEIVLGLPVAKPRLERCEKEMKEAR